jgi:two-component system response regulator RegA
MRCDLRSKSTRPSPRNIGRRIMRQIEWQDWPAIPGDSGVAELISAVHDERPALAPDGSIRSLLLVEDDAPFRERLARALTTRGFEVAAVESVAEGLAQIAQRAPPFAVIDLRLSDGNGLDVIAELRRHRPDVRAVIVTGYGNIASAVTAVKVGAVDYLAKPVDADDVVAVLLAQSGCRAQPPKNPMSADRVRWEHIQHVHAFCGGNVSETARQLQMHRRTLQRILSRRPPK